MINLKEGRKGFESIGNTYPVAENVIQQNINIAGVSCAWFNPLGAVDDEIVFYIHGGAFIFGSIASHTPMVSHIARELKRKVLMIDYRLAPEYPFPAGIDDCVAVITAVQAANPDRSFGIMGDSAGGNVTMATNLVLNQRGGPSAQYTIVISPWADLECKNESYVRNRMADVILVREYLVEAARLYAGGAELTEPLLSPVNGDFTGLAPVLILCGTHEILEDDALHLHRTLLDSGVEAVLERFDAQLHVWPFMNIYTDASIEALKDIAEFANKHSLSKGN